MVGDPSSDRIPTTKTQARTKHWTNYLIFFSSTFGLASLKMCKPNQEQEEQPGERRSKLSWTEICSENSAARKSKYRYEVRWGKRHRMMLTTPIIPKQNSVSVGLFTHRGRELDLDRTKEQAFCSMICAIWMWLSRGRGFMLHCPDPHHRWIIIGGCVSRLRVMTLHKLESYLWSRRKLTYRSCIWWIIRRRRDGTGDNLVDLDVGDWHYSCSRNWELASVLRRLY